MVRGSQNVVEEFWAAIGRDDLGAAGALLHDEHVLEWLQSGERVRERGNFVALNDPFEAAAWRARWVDAPRPAQGTSGAGRSMRKS